MVCPLLAKADVDGIPQPSLGAVVAFTAVLVVQTLPFPAAARGRRGSGAHSRVW